MAMASFVPRRYFFGLRGSRLQRAQIWVVILPAYMLFGYNNGVAGPLLDLGPWTETFPTLNTLTTSGEMQAHNSQIQGTVVALYALGAFLGSLSTVFFGDRLGRIRTIQVGAAGTAVGAIISSSSFSLAQLTVGRLVIGIGYGALSATAPNWQSECASAAHRGAAVLYESVFISFGLAVGGWIELGVSFAADSQQYAEVSWRFPLALPALLAIVVFFLVPLFPESPRWLIKHGRVEEAVDALSALSGNEASSVEVRNSIEEIDGSLGATGTEVAFSALFRNGEERLAHRAFLAALVQCFQQVCGINALAFFLSTIFESYLGFTGTQSRVISAAVFSWQTLCSPIGVLTVDRYGRRRLMLASALGMGVCMAVIAGTSSQTQSRAAAGVAGAFIFLFGAFFPVGFLSLTFLYAAEIAPLAARVPVTAISTATAWIFNFLVAEVTPLAFDRLGWRYYVIYAALNLGLIAPCIYFLFPETAGRHLEEVDSIFRRSAGLLDPVRVAADDDDDSSNDGRPAAPEWRSEANTHVDAREEELETARTAAWKQDRESACGVKR